MKILVTGASGFVGRNLTEALEKSDIHEIYPVDHESDPQLLKVYTEKAEFVFHFAAVHRPDDEKEFFRVNLDYFAALLAKLKEAANRSPVLYTSTIQAVQDTEYGRSKRAAEEALKEHARDTGNRAIIYRLTNTFGRYARPHSHSVVATFCHNIARGFPIKVSDPDHRMNFYYIDDVIASFIKHLTRIVHPDPDGFYRLPKELEYAITLGELADKICTIKNRIDKDLPKEAEDDLTEKLTETYLSYLP